MNVQKLKVFHLQWALPPDSLAKNSALDPSRVFALPQTTIINSSSPLAMPPCQSLNKPPAALYASPVRHFVCQSSYFAPAPNLNMCKNNLPV